MSSHRFDRKERLPIRLCVVSPVHIENVSSWWESSGKFGELAEISKNIEACYLIISSRRFEKYASKHVTIYAFPGPSSKISLRNISLTPVSFVLEALLILFVVLHYKANLMRADHVLKNGLPVSMVSRMTKVPFVLFVGGDTIETLAIKLGSSSIKELLARSIINLSSYLEARVVLKAAYVLAVTPEIVQKMNDLGANKVGWCTTYVNQSLFVPRQKQQKQKRVLFIGRLEPEKGVGVFVQMASYLRNCGAKFVIVGTGSKWRQIDDMIRSQGLSEKFEIKGLKQYSAMPFEYREADVVVLPSFSEGIPMTTLEAFSCERAVVMSRVGIARHMQNGVHAIIVSPGDVFSTAVAVRKLLENPKLRHRIAKEGWKFMNQKLGGYCKQHLQIYLEVLKARNL